MLLMADVIIGHREVVWSLEQPEQCSTVAVPLRQHSSVWRLGEPASKVHIPMLSECEHAKAKLQELQLE